MILSSPFSNHDISGESMWKCQGLRILQRSILVNPSRWTSPSESPLIFQLRTMWWCDALIERWFVEATSPYLQPCLLILFFLRRYDNGPHQFPCSKQTGCVWQPSVGSSARLVPGATVGVLQPPSGVGSPERVDMKNWTNKNFPNPPTKTMTYTPREFNIAPENRPSQKESSLPTIIFQGLC